MAQASVPKCGKNIKQTLKQESGCHVSDEANTALYTEHEVKQEVVLGPVQLQLSDVAYKLRGKSERKEEQPETHITCKMDTTVPVKPAAVKQEPMWKTEECTETLLADLKVKEELLETDLHRVNAENIKKEPLNPGNAGSFKDATLKQESVYRTDRLTDRQTKEMKVSTKRLKKTKNKVKDTKKSSKIIQISSRLRIQFEEEPYNIDNKIDIKNVTKYECEKCLKQFRFKGSLKTHMRIHTGEKPYSCPFCMKEFSDLAVLCRHKRTHTGQKPHVCDVCNKSYSEKYLLKNHKRVHTGEKVYFCKYCSKSFTNSSNYRKHERIHSDKYSCDICSRYFQSKSSLTKHINNHTKPKAHVCQICQKCFKIKGHLNRHVESHVGAKTVYACGVCQTKFTQHSSLKRHVAKRVCKKNNMFRNINK